MDNLTGLEKYMDYGKKAVSPVVEPFQEEEPEYPEGYAVLDSDMKMIRKMLDAMPREARAKYFPTAEDTPELADKKARFWNTVKQARKGHVIEEMPPILEETREQIKPYMHVLNQDEIQEYIEKQHPFVKVTPHGKRFFIQMPKGRKVPPGATKEEAIEILSKEPYSADMHVLDPKSNYLAEPEKVVTDPLELGRDLHDVARDQLRGMAESGAALGGAMITPFSPLTGASTGSGAYAFSQHLADQQRAIDNGLRTRPLSFEDAAWEGLISAGFTGMFGTGAAKEQLRGEPVLKETVKAASERLPLLKKFADKFYDLTGERVPEEQLTKMIKGHRGLASRFLSKTGKAVAPMLSVTSRNMMNIASRNIDKFRRLAKASEEDADQGAGAFIKQYGVPARDYVRSQSKELQRNAGDVLSKLTGTLPEDSVNMAPVYGAIDDFSGKLLDQYRNATDDKQRKAFVETAKALKEKFFHSDPHRANLSISDRVQLEKEFLTDDPDEILKLLMSRLSKLKSGRSAIIKKHDNLKSPEFRKAFFEKYKPRFKALQRALIDARQKGHTGRASNIEDRISELRIRRNDDWNTYQKMNEMRLSPELERFENEYATTMSQANFFKRKVKHPVPFKDGNNVVTNTDDEFTSLKQFLVETGVLDPDRIYSSKPLKMSGEDAWQFRKELGEMAELRKRAKDPNIVGTPAQGVYERLVGLGKASDKVGKQIDNALQERRETLQIGELDKEGKTFTDALKDYQNIKRVQDILSKMTDDDPQKAWNVVRDLFKESNASLLDKLNQYAPEVLKMAEEVEAFRVWGRSMGQNRGIVKAADRSRVREMVMKSIGIGGGIGAGAGLSVLGGPAAAFSWPIGTAIGLGLVTASDPKFARSVVDARDLATGLAPALQPGIRTYYDIGREQERLRGKYKEK